MNSDKESIKSVSEFIDQVKDKRKKLKQSKSEISATWFRGESSVYERPLVPKAYRKDGGLWDFEDIKESVYKNAKAVENNLIGTFSRYSMTYFNKNNIENNEWNNYFLMQHYGLRTRLLDWTESALIALYFSVSSRNGKNDAVVWILSPHNLNEYHTKLFLSKGSLIVYFPQSIEKKSLFDQEKLNYDELMRRYLKRDFKDDVDEPSNKYYPLAIYPYLLDDRMAAQKSCFTIFGNEVNGLMESKGQENFLDRVQIDRLSKKNIKDELEWLGITEQTIYPDLSGTCKWIEDKYTL